jgi:hypothetical protein
MAYRHRALAPSSCRLNLALCLGHPDAFPAGSRHHASRSGRRPRPGRAEPADTQQCTNLCSERAGQHPTQHEADESRGATAGDRGLRPRHGENSFDGYCLSERLSRAICKRFRSPLIPCPRRCVPFERLAQFPVLLFQPGYCRAQEHFLSGDLHGRSCYIGWFLSLQRARRAYQCSTHGSNCSASATWYPGCTVSANRRCVVMRRTRFTSRLSRTR